MKKILLIGDRGYVGSELKSFLEKNYEVYGCDIGWFSKEKGLDYKDLHHSFIAKFSHVILLAGHSSVGQCKNNNYSAFNNNVINFVDLIYKLNKSQILIYASSGSLCSGKINAAEDFTCEKFNNSYDFNKSVIEKYADQSGIKCYGLRFGTVAGSSKNLRIDILINAFINSYKTKGYLEITNGDINRSCLGIKDLCRGIESIIEKPAANSGIYNLASFSETVENLSQRCQEVLKCAVIDKGSSGTPYNFTLSTKKFESEFDFKFRDTVESITLDLLQNWDNCTKTDRFNPIIY